MHYSGKIHDGIRPTSDKVRQAIFNSLSNFVDFNGLYCLDLCAGTGALGFEALSRGAEIVTFVDNSRKSCDLIANIAKTFKVPAKNFQIICRDALKYVENMSDERDIDIIFCDPPYKSDIIEPLLNKLIEKGISKSGTIMVLEYSKSYSFTFPVEYKRLNHKEFGDTFVDFVELIR